MISESLNNILRYPSRECFAATLRVAASQEMVRKKFYKVGEKSGNFILSQGKLK